MSSVNDALMRLQVLEQRLAAVEAAAANITPAAEDRGQAVTVFAPYSGTLGNAVKLVSGTWSDLTASDVVAGPIGVVVGLSSGWAEIQIAGPRVASGTPGDSYFAPTSAGAPTATDPGGGDPPYSTPIERQIAPGLRQVGGMGGGGGPSSITVALPGAYSGSVGDALICQASSWGLVTDTTPGFGPCGVVISIVDGVATVLLQGTFPISGTAGDTYYASHTGGSLTPTRPTPAVYPTTQPYERIIAYQIDGGNAMVVQMPPYRILAVDDCETTPTTHWMFESA